jgi:hypothetical protein
LPVSLLGPGTAARTEQLVVRLEVEIYGRPFAGHAALTLPAGPASEAARDAVQNACRLALQAEGRGILDTCLRLREALDPPAGATPAARLHARRGHALVERALLDAVARRAGRSLAALLLDRADNPLALDWGRAHPLLQGLGALEFLPPHPYQTQEVRLPVWPGDVLTGPEGGRGTAPPLDATIRRCGFTRFEIRVRSVHDVAFAAEALRVIRLHAPPGWRWSLDAAGAFPDTSAFFEMWTELRSHPSLDDPLRRLEHILHPFEPRHAGGARIERFFKGWPARLPVLLDPSGLPDAEAVPSLDLGYAGFVVRSEEGFFRALTLLALVHRLRERRAGQLLATSLVGAHGETPYGLAQDAVLHAIAGSDVVTRRTPLDAPDLEDQPLALQQLAVETLPGLYAHDTGGRPPRLAIQGGRLRLAGALPHPTGLPPALGEHLFGVDEFAEAAPALDWLGR